MIRSLEVRPHHKEEHVAEQHEGRDSLSGLSLHHQVSTDRERRNAYRYRDDLLRPLPHHVDMTLAGGY